MVEMNFNYKELTSVALETASSVGAEYADIRIVNQKSESLTVKNSELDELTLSEDMGFGVRMIVNGSWGFASSNNVTKDEITRITKLAYETARASSKLNNTPVVLAPIDIVEDNYETPVEIDPFSLSLEEKVEPLMKAEALLRQNPAVKIGTTSADFYQIDKVFASTEGAYITQKLIETGAGMIATALDEGEMQVRSYPNSHRGDFATAGFEFFKGLDLQGNAERIGEESAALLKAPQCPPLETEVILDGSQLALQVHESLGHPAELDRVLGTEISYAGGSFLTLDKLSKFKYGSDIVNIYADATIEKALGSFAYDDEGVKAQRTDLVKNGTLAGYLTSRETAGKVNANPNATMRADSWGSIPLIRMTNINLAPGDAELEELIADTKDGVYLETNKSWSIDDKRLNFQFATEVGWRIKNGRKTELLKNCNYAGITPEFWNNCNAITNDKHWHVWGLPNCGKGQPPQIAHVAHGTSPARFSKVKVGVGA